MRFLEYLFFKYYNWAIKVGDGDVPSTTSVICISFCILLYFMDIVMAISFFYPAGLNFNSAYKYVFPLVPLLSFFLLYCIFVVKGKDKQIMEKHRDEWTDKKNLGAILFPIIAFIIYAGELYIKMLMNRGVL